MYSRSERRQPPLSATLMESTSMNVMMFVYIAFLYFLSGVLTFTLPHSGYDVIHIFRRHTVIEGNSNSDVKIQARVKDAITRNNELGRISDDNNDSFKDVGKQFQTHVRGQGAQRLTSNINKTSKPSSNSILNGVPIRRRVTKTYRDGEFAHSVDYSTINNVSESLDTVNKVTSNTADNMIKHIDVVIRNQTNVQPIDIKGKPDKFLHDRGILNIYPNDMAINNNSTFIELNTSSKIVSDKSHLHTKNSTQDRTKNVFPMNTNSGAGIRLDRFKRDSYQDECDIRTYSTCPWVYNDDHEAECLTTHPVGCNTDLSLIECRKYYFRGIAVACIATRPCMVNSEGVILPPSSACSE